MYDVVIVGGGLGGLATATALAQRGLEVAVLDARHEMAPDFFGYTLWPPASRALRGLGVLEEVIAQGCRLSALRWFNHLGDPWSSLELAGLGDDGEFIGVLPSRLHAILEEAARRHGATILRGVRQWTLSRGRSGSPTVRAPDIDEIRAAVLVGCDGAESAVRRELRARAIRWRPPRQTIFTGIGGALPFSESHQSLGDGWSSGCLSLGAGGSWLYGIFNTPPMGEPVAATRASARDSAELREALRGLRRVALVRPWSTRVLRWAFDGALLAGDAAHPMLPHLGLGGSMTLEDAPVAAEVLTAAIGEGDVSATRLGEFQRRRASRVAYAQRVSDMWAISTTAAFPGVGHLRDLNLRRISTKPQLLESFVRELTYGTPRLPTRLRLMLP